MNSGWIMFPLQKCSVVSCVYDYLCMCFQWSDHKMFSIPFNFSADQLKSILKPGGNRHLVFYNKYNLFMIKHAWITHLSIIPFIKCILVFMIKWSSWIFVHMVLMFFLLLWCCEIRIRMYETNTSVVTWVMPWYCVQTLERVHYGGRTVSPVFRTFFFFFQKVYIPWHKTENQQVLRGLP